MICLSTFGVFYGKEDDDPRLWGVFLSLGMLLVVVDLVLIFKMHRCSCLTKAENNVDPADDAPV